MRLYSTKNHSKFVDLKKAVLKGLPEDNGLYMPEFIPEMPDYFFKNIENYTFAEHAYVVAKTLLQGAIPNEELKEIIDGAVNFPAPIVSLKDDLHILELFHGPSLAFKDFGARFMARVMGYFNQGEEKNLTILVATSGDTGGAVAAGVYDTPGIDVVILYPSGKVSHLQEKQLTTLGKNIRALEVDGTFDDCQALVKQAFLDDELTSKVRLSSANSINISRLIPQSFYYFEAYKQLKDKSKPAVYCIPSGNFGNLTAGLLAKKMGLPVDHFVAATNANDVVPQYLETGEYKPRPSVRTLSNAMDVGAPSNFQRMTDLYGMEWEAIKGDVSGYAYTDEQTKEALLEVYKTYDYLIDPHGAVGYLALKEYMESHPGKQGIVLETAHPSKFKPDVEDIIGGPIDVPQRLAELSDKKKEAKQMGIEYAPFKEWILKNC